VVGWNQRAEPFGGDVPDVFRAVALEPLAASPRLSGNAATLYREQMHKPRRRGMFSFVPAAGDGRLFAQPIIEAPRFVNPRKRESAKATVVTAAKAWAAWNDVIGQVRTQGFDLAVYLAEPEILPDHIILDDAAEPGCAEGVCKAAGNAAQSRPHGAGRVDPSAQGAADVLTCRFAAVC
jgi:hypothetical protein